MQISVDPWYAIFPKLAITYGLILEGNFPCAQDHIAEIIEFSNSFGAEFAVKPAQFFRAMVLIAEGKIDQGLKIAEKIYQSWLENGSILRQAACGSMLAAVYASLAGKFEDSQGVAASAAKEAHSHFQASIRAGKRIGVNGVLGRAYLNWGYLHQQEKNEDRAGQCFTAATQYFHLCNSEAFLAQARNELEMLDQKTEDSQKFGSRNAEVGMVVQDA